ncbi:MAG TPA: hypothetical protein PLX08_04945 [Bacteroidales bacterium]|jgi:hypothetical protein|nr:hypothetical protein [Bacteroidales bacterium]
MENLEPPAEVIHVPPAHLPENAEIAESVEYIPPVVVDTITAADQTQITADEALASRQSEAVDECRSGSGDYLAP